jgi:hypothetical protein
LRVHQGRDFLQAVFNPVLELVKQQLLFLGSLLELLLGVEAIDCRSDQVRATLQEIGITSRETIEPPAVHFEHTEGRPLALYKDVYGAFYAVLLQDRRDLET